MTKFRKKPVVIEAEQFEATALYLGPTARPLPQGVCMCSRGLGDIIGFPHIHTLEGEMLVSDGDWVITGIKGERYPCKPDIFAQTYEPVDV